MPASRSMIPVISLDEPKGEIGARGVSSGTGTWAAGLP